MSDSESQDSDDGIRYKTTSTRFKNLSPSPKKGDTIGPELPPHLTKRDIGPELPPNLKKRKLEEPNLKKQKLEEDSCIGPQLPPHLSKQTEETEKEVPRIGPQLPPHFSKSFGPQLPVNFEHNQDSDDEDYGPLPAGTSTTSRAQIALEERALQLKMDQLGPDKEKLPVREEWMVELPTVKAGNFGLGPRQFRSKAGPDLSDRSSWTDTPDKKKSKEKEEKVDLKKETEVKEIRRRDEEQEKISKKMKRKKESLLEIHQTKMKEKKKEEGPAERRPFSRELDLQVNRFDEAQKKAVLKKAQLLDDRFSRGQSKFL